MRIRAPLVALCLGTTMASGCYHDNAPPAAPARSATAAAALPSAAVSEAPTVSSDGAPPAPRGAYPFPAPSDDAVWATLAWGMTVENATRALQSVGLAAEVPGYRAKGTEVQLGVSDGPWNVIVFFDEDGGSESLSKILVTGKELTESVAEAARQRMVARFGSPTESNHRQEHEWRANEELVVRVRVGPGRPTVNEQRFATGPGDAGWGSLHWGMSEVVVDGLLRSEGFDVKPAVPPRPGCLTPNPPLDCGDPISYLLFSAGPWRGRGDFRQGIGLFTLDIWSDTADEVAVRKRLAEIAADRGAADHVTDAMVSKWSLPGMEASLVVEHHLPRDHYEVTEEYMRIGSGTGGLDGRR